MPKKVPAVYAYALIDHLTITADSIEADSGDPQKDSVSNMRRAIYGYLIRHLPPDACASDKALHRLDTEVTQIAHETLFANGEGVKGDLEKLRNGLIPQQLVEKARAFANRILGNQAVALSALVQLKKDALVTRLSSTSVGCEHCGNQQCQRRDPNRFSPLDEYAEQLASTARTQVRQPSEPAQDNRAEQGDETDDEAATIFKV